MQLWGCEIGQNNVCYSVGGSVSRETCPVPTEWDTVGPICTVVREVFTAEEKAENGMRIRQECKRKALEGQKWLLCRLYP